MPSISEDMTVQNDDTHSATSELKAAARDVLRVGKQWAHAAQEWFDDRRNEMSQRNRDERAYEEGQRTIKERMEDNVRLLGDFDPNDLAIETQRHRNRRIPLAPAPGAFRA